MLYFSEPVLRLLQTPEEAVEPAKEYLNICLLGTIFVFGYNAISSIQRGLGDSKRPLYFVAVACVINVGLDLLLVGPFEMGPGGRGLGHHCGPGHQHDSGRGLSGRKTNLYSILSSKALP